MSRDGQGTAPPPIHAHLLGDIRISVGARPITDDDWPRRNARNLLLLLLITPGHRLPRDRVVDLLWPELSVASAANALYVALHGLRRVLEPDLAKGRASAYIDSSAETIAIRAAASTFVDLDVFDAALASSAAAAPDARRSALRQALALYTGQLLPADLYEDWASGRREAIQLAWEDAVLDLAALDMAADEPQATVAPLEQLLATDVTHEAAHRALMRAYAASGQRDRALRQYDRCRRALEEELGAKPDDETEALHDAIKAAALEPPAADTVSNRFNNLPAPPAPIVGREREVEAVQGLLWRQDVRLVTLTGTGGIGKTRLAIEVATGLVEDFADGVAFVPLATVREPSLVLPTIARALGVGEEVSQGLATTLKDYLCSRDFLLVLDNMEQILDASSGIGELLGACPRLSILITSRERLQLRGEHVHEVPPLTVPQPDRLPAVATLVRYEAVALFRQHFRLLHPHFDIDPENGETVAAICHHLDGLPLAIELAAARGRFLSLPELLDGLASRFDLLQDGPHDLPDRQRTLWDTIAWSYDLLTSAERVVFNRLAVFADGCTVAAAETVASLPDEDASLTRRSLYSLAEKHLIRWEETDDEPRLTMLETIRAFALEQLRESGEEPDLCRRHATSFLRIAEQAEAGLVGPDQAAWRERLEREHDNLGAALGWALDQSDEIGNLAVCAAASLWRYWWLRGLMTEGVAWLERATSRPETEPTARARALLEMAELIEIRNDYTGAKPVFEEALALCREIGDLAGAAQALGGLGNIAQDRGEYEVATSLHEQALALYRLTDRRRDSASVLNSLATVAYYQGKSETAAARWNEALVIVRNLGDSWATGMLLGNLGSLAISQGDVDQAVTLHGENLAVARQIQDPGAIGRALSNLAEVRQIRGDGDQTALLEEALGFHRQAEDKQAEASTLNLLGKSALGRGDTKLAANFYAGSLKLCQQTGERTTSTNTALFENVAALAVTCGRFHEAARLLGASEALREKRGAPLLRYQHVGYDETVACISAALGEDAVAGARNAGRSLSDDAIIDAALALCEEMAVSSDRASPVTAGTG
jgi:predicted ATPase/DNA-binding SARP family transcriptional activator